ncbi:MAG: cytochrome c biogenesis protein CcdA [Candidatus Omnitrophica bacterium]|nr:cytochrome c biogenesis protein CcdA [Candidatus Omnitrophota bacterium]
MTENVSVFMAFGAGLVSFFSPCVFPLIPAFLSYLTGISFSSIENISLEEKKEIRRKTINHTLWFIGGFTVVFVLLGLTSSFVGKFFLQYQKVFLKMGAVLIIFLGLFVMGLLKIPAMAKHAQIDYRKKRISYIGSCLVGMSFAFAWTPCVGPILASVLIYASSAASMQKGAFLLAVFSLGMGIPFLIAAIFINSFLLIFSKIKRIIKYVNILCGIGLVVFGILILIGR